MIKARQSGRKNDRLWLLKNIETEFQYLEKIRLQYNSDTNIPADVKAEKFDAMEKRISYLKKIKAELIACDAKK